MDNSLAALRETQATQTLEQRVEILESKIEDLELVLAGLVPLPRRRPGSFKSWLQGRLFSADPGD